MSIIDINDTFENIYNRGSEPLSGIFPFLLERKYCYSNPESRSDSATDTEAKHSKFNFNGAQKPLILKNYTDLTDQPDDILRNYLNGLTDILLDGVTTWNSNSVTNKLANQLSMSTKGIKELTEEKIDYLNKDVSNLNNNQFKNTRKYETTHFNYNLYKFNCNMAVNSMLFISSIFILMYLSKDEYSLISPKLGLYLTMILLVIFAFYLLIKMNTKNIRNKSDWNKINFRQVNAEDKV